MCIMFRDKWIILFFKFPFCGDFSLHLHKMVQETSRNITQAENLQRHVFLKLAYADINTSDISCLLNGRKHIGPEETQKQYPFFLGGGGTYLYGLYKGAPSAVNLSSLVKELIKEWMSWHWKTCQFTAAAYTTRKNILFFTFQVMLSYIISSWSMA